MVESKRRNTICWKGVVLLLLVSFAGCKTKQNRPDSISNEAAKKETTVSTAKTSEMVKPQITSLNYEWLSYRMNVSILDYNTQKEMQNVSAFYVNRKDSIIYVTVSKIIELARIVLTPDSVKYIEHLSATYYKGDYSFLTKLMGFNVNFKLIQSLFAGEDIPDFEPNTFFVAAADTTVYTSKLRKNKQINLSVSQEMKTNLQHKIIENNIKEIQKQFSLSIKYAGFAPIDKSQLFFQQAELSIPTESLRLNLSLRDVKINIPIPTSINIPSKYKSIE